MDITQYDKRHLLASVKLAGNNFVLLSALPGFHAWVGRQLRFRPTAANIEYILENWPEATWDADSGKFRDRLGAKLLNASETAVLKQLPDSSFKSNFQFRRKPYDHQVKAFELSKDRETFALFMDQGTGKTKVILDTAAHLVFQDKIDMLIVIAPKGVHENWTLNEIPKDWVDWIECEYWAFTTNQAKYQIKERDRVLTSDAFKIITINVEGFAERKGKLSKSAEILEWCLENFRCLLVIDESSRIRTPGAKRTKYLIKMGRDAPYRRILTGTPVPKGMENLYSQLGFLDWDIIGFDTYTSFKRRYCHMIEMEGHREMITGYKNTEELIAKIDGFSFRVRKEECLDLPPKIYKQHPLHLTKNQARVYNELIDECWTQMDDEEMTADLAIVQIMRLQQIVSGWFVGDDSRKALPIDEPNERMKSLKEVLRDVEGKVVIWARFIADLDLIASTLESKAIRYRGDLADVDRFQTDDAVRYLVANPASAGLGLTLTAAETVIYYSNSFDLEHRLQSEDRTHRIGTTGTVTYIDLSATGTIDQKIITALRSKKLISDAVLQDPSDFFMEYKNE